MGYGGGIGTFNEAFAEFFLNTPSNIVQLETIELSHPSFSQTFWIVRNAINGLVATDETDTVRTFVYYPLKIVPSSTSNDLDQTIQVQFGDLGEILPQQLDLLLPSGEETPMLTKPTLIYRTWRSDDLSAPLNGPYTFNVDNVAFQKEGATLSCSAQQLNVAATGELYSISRFPMLIGYL
jgi:uncharacterized protein DUF1833